MPMGSEQTIPPVTLISGFLGSGKTTLLRRLIAAAQRRIGIIVNEFGALGIDGALLAQSDAGALIELSGGCVCCAAGSDLLLALETLSDDRSIEAIAIETSGLAEPGAIARQLRAAGAPLDTLVTLVSAVDYERALAASPLALRQIQLADLILLTHGDLVSAQRCAQVSAWLGERNPRAPVVPANHGMVAPDLIFSPRPTAPLPVDLPHHHHDFHALAWTADLPLRRAQLEQTLRALSTQGLWRAKGIVCCTDAPWADEVHLVSGRLTFNAFRLSRLPSPLCRLTLIGREPALTQAQTLLDGCVDSAERISHWRERLAAAF